MTDEIIDRQFQILADAIVLQAVRDYEYALTHNDTRMQFDCERFFRSDKGLLFTHLDGEEVIRKLKKGVAEFEKLAYPIIAEGKEMQHAFDCPICGGNVVIKNSMISTRSHKYKLIAMCESCLFKV